MSQLDLGTQSLMLERYPQHEQSASLQAWEAADEYLLQQIDPIHLQGRPLLIFNDQFGTLSCALHAFSPHHISDSYMSQRAVRHNLYLNEYDVQSISLLDSLSQLPENPGLVIIKIPKTLALLEWQLHALRRVVSPDTVVIAGAKARDIHTSTLQLFERILGPTTTTLAWKKARLIHTQVAERQVKPLAATQNWTLEQNGYLIHNHANVFSRGNLDIGARFFMQHLPHDLEGNIVDLGCGNGVIGLTALAQNPHAQVRFIDESYMAVASSRLNVEHNVPQDLTRCQFQVNDSLAGIERASLQAVLCNPPFHQQHVITDEVAWQMFCDARYSLAVGGELRIVGNRHLDYYQKLKRLFGNCTTLDTNKKFVVLRSVKLAAGYR